MTTVPADASLFRLFLGQRVAALHQRGELRLLGGDAVGGEILVARAGKCRGLLGELADVVADDGNLAIDLVQFRRAGHVVPLPFALAMQLRRSDRDYGCLPCRRNVSVAHGDALASWRTASARALY